MSVVKLTVSPDGRATRWRQHNAKRRRELVTCALRAIRKHGPAVGMDEIAVEAGTSKTVIYRHFGGRTGLYTAVVESVHEFIWSNLHRRFERTEGLEPADLVRTITNTYLSLVERDPDIYQFVVTRPLDSSPVTDPVTSITGRIGDEVSTAFATWLRARGDDESPAATWGHGVVGFVWAIADTWVTSGHTRPRADIVDFTARLFDPAFAHQGAGSRPEGNQR